MSQKPYVGAVVHYFDKFAGSRDPRAAIITKVHDDKWVALFIIAEGGGTRFASHVELGAGWEWIPPQPAQVDMFNPSGWAGGIGG